MAEQNAASTIAISGTVMLTADIVAAYVSGHPLKAADLPALIDTVHSALVRLGQAGEPNEKPTPPVPIKKTITPDAIISLEDGKPYKTLKRHLSGRGLTPEQYRTKWGLPADYPMIAERYATQRSELAKAIGLGSMRRRVTGAEPAKPVRRHKAEPT